MAPVQVHGWSAGSSVMQLSTYTKVPSIPCDTSYTDFSVTVCVKATEMTEHQQAPLDVIAVIDVSWSMGWDDPNGNVPNNRLVLVKDAMKKVIENVGVRGAQNRLAVVAFDHEIKAATELLAMTEQGQKSLSQTVDALKPFGRTVFSIGLKKAAEILDGRAAAEKDRLAYIIFLSDGNDPDFVKESIPPRYPIHALGFSADHDPSKLQAMADATLGSYTPINHNLERISEKLDQLSDKLASIVAVGVLVAIRALHPGVYLSRIEPSAADGAGDTYRGHISADGRSGEISLGAVSTGKGREFTVYLHVPEDKGGAAATMSLVAVGGVFTQSWDRKQAVLGDSVVAVARPGSCGGCACNNELEWIEKRLEYWCKVKRDLSAMYDMAEEEAKAAGGGGDDGGCRYHVAGVLRGASAEAIDKAMHHDIYTALLHAINLRPCAGDNGGAAASATEKATTPPPTQATKDVQG